MYFSVCSYFHILDVSSLREFIYKLSAWMNKWVHGGKIASGGKKKMFPNGQGNMLKEGSILCSPRVLVFKTDDRIWCHSVLHPSLHQSRWLIQQKSKLKRRHSCRLRSLLFPLSFLISMAWLPSKCQKVKYRHLFLWVFPLKPQFSTLCWLSYIQMEGNMMPLINIWKQGSLPSGV